MDERTNTIFFRETRSNIDNIRKMLVQIDKPTKQVMIEARLVEVTRESEAKLRNQLGGCGRGFDQSANDNLRHSSRTQTAPARDGRQ